MNINWDRDTNNRNNEYFVHNQIMSKAFDKYKNYQNKNFGKLFLDREMDRDVIFKMKKEIARDCFLDDDNDAYYIECILTLLSLQLCDGTEDYWQKIDIIEYHTSYTRWIIRDYIKKFLGNSHYNKIGQNLIQSASKVFDTYIKENIFLNTSLKHIKQYYQEVVTQWKEKDYADYSILWDERDYESLSWRGQKTLFFCLYILDKETFIRKIQQFQDPYSIKMALSSIESELSFNNWSAFLEKSCDPFDINENEFNKNKILAPLLLYFADYKIELFVNSYNIHLCSDSEEVNKLCEEIRYIVNEVVILLRNQKMDFLLHRWVLYKFEKIQDNAFIDSVEIKENEYPNIRLYINSYIVTSYVDSLISFPGYVERQNELELWKNPLSHEKWGQYILYGMWGKNNINRDLHKIISNFLHNWQFDSKTWYEEKGEAFRKESERFNIFNKEIILKKDKYFFISQLLFNFIKEEDSLDIWFRLLKSADVCLDAIQYQKYKDKHINFDNKYSSENFLKLLSIIGLYTLDSLVTQSSKYSEDFYRSLCSLVFRCYKQDRWSINKLWFNLIIHLMIRRNFYSSESNASKYCDLNSSVPKVSDFLFLFKNDYIPLFKLIYYLKINGVDENKIIRSLEEEKINLNILIKEYEELHKLDNERYSIHKTIKKMILELIEKQQKN